MTRPSMAAVRELAGWKEPCLAATTANISLTGLQTVDGVVLASGDRVLVKDQSTASQNGIYNVSEGEWYRSPDAMSSRNVAKRIYVAVQGGSTNASTVWIFDTLEPDLGTDSITIVEADFGGGGGGAEVEYATVPQVRAATAGLKILVAEHVETAAAFVALTDAATVAVDWDSGINFSLTLGGNRTLANPSNGQPGTWRTFVITQDGTGSRTMAFGDQYKFVGGDTTVMSTAAAAVDVLSVFCVTASNFFVFSGLNMSP